jgi:hypothetical protein
VPEPMPVPEPEPEPESFNGTNLVRSGPEES